MHLKRAIATIVGSALLAAACSGTTETPSRSASATTASATTAGATPAALPSAGPTPADACSLLTLNEVSSAINFIVNTDIGDVSGRRCTWTYADPNVMVAFNTARLDIIDPATFGINQVGSASGTTVTPVVGYGDAAFFVDAGPGGTSLSVEKGSRAFTVSVQGSAYTTAQSEADEKTLAGYVLARL